MDGEQWIKVAQLGLGLIQAFIWPAALIFIVIYFGSPLKKFISNLGEISLKAGTSGIEATAKRQQIEAAALLGAAAARQTAQAPPDEQVSEQDQVRQIANAVSEAVTPKAGRKLSGARILWVDDRPSNNVYERGAMEALGIKFTISTSTDDALEKVRSSKFDAIISDMGRPPDPEAGYTLLDKLRATNIDIPLIIYAGSNAPKHKAEAREHGAVGSTNNPQELFQLVTSAIQHGGVTGN